MKLLCKQDQMLDVFTGKNSLLDGKITKIEISGSRESVCIDVSFIMRSSSEYNHVLLRFDKCKEYSFFYSNDCYFYNVEHVKYLQAEDELYYISFDPFNEEEVINEQDQDYILCGDISAYLDVH